MNVSTNFFFLDGFSDDCPRQIHFNGDQPCAIISTMDEPDFVLYEVDHVISFGEGGLEAVLFYPAEYYYLFYPWPIPISSGCVAEPKSCFLIFEDGKSLLLGDHGVRAQLNNLAGDVVGNEGTLTSQDEVRHPNLARLTWIADSGAPDRPYPKISIGQTEQTLGQTVVQNIDQTEQITTQNGLFVKKNCLKFQAILNPFCVVRSPSIPGIFDILGQFFPLDFPIFFIYLW